MKPLSLQADNSNRRMIEDKVQRALLQWIRSRKISFILQIKLAVVSLDFMSEKSAQIQSRKVHWSSIVLDTYLTKIVQEGTSKQRHCTPLHWGN